jgi:hypothetical protein
MGVGPRFDQELVSLGRRFSPKIHEVVADAVELVERMLKPIVRVTIAVSRGSRWNSFCIPLTAGQISRGALARP